MITTTIEDEARLIAQYVEKLAPLVSLAQKAYGRKNQITPAHNASREYTQILVEYHKTGGSLVRLGKALKVSYSGIARRVAMADGPPISNSSARSRATPLEVHLAVERVKSAKLGPSRQYHAQLAHEYYNNHISLAAIATGLGIKNSFPLYYGIQRHLKRALDK